LLGLQFDELFTNGLYAKIGKTAILAAEKIRQAVKQAGYTLYSDSPSNQIFIKLVNAAFEALSTQIEFSVWEKLGDAHTVVRVATNWATTEEDVERFITAISRA
jgi:threonine aldolase